MAKGSGYTLRSSVTIGSLRTLQKLGLGTVEGVKFSQALLETMADETKLRQACNAIFAESFDAVPLEEIDLKRVSAGVRDFLAGLINPS